MANGPNRGEKMVGVSPAPGSASKTCCKCAPNALIVVLGSFCFSWGNNGVRSNRHIWMFRTWWICPSRTDPAILLLRVGAAFLWEVCCEKVIAVPRGSGRMSLPSRLSTCGRVCKNVRLIIWLRKVLSTEKDCTKSAGQKVTKVLFRRRK